MESSGGEPRGVLGAAVRIQRSQRRHGCSAPESLTHRELRPMRRPATCTLGGGKGGWGGGGRKS